MMSPLGLIAGEGVFPLLVARGARAAGRRVVCAGLAGCAWPQLREECDRFQTVGITRLGSWIRFLKSAGVQDAIMVGRVAKSRMYDRWRYIRHIPDFRTLRLWLTRLRRDKRPYAVLSALIDELDSAGINLIDSTTYTLDQMASAGVMTRKHPTDAQWEDIHFGFEVGQQISRLDIGQAIAVLSRDVIAVEALEGTAAMIERAAKLCRTGGWTLVKVSNTTQDMRVDVPSIGTATIESLRSARGGCIVLEAGKTIMLEKQKVIELADRYKIAIVGLPMPPSALIVTMDD